MPLKERVNACLKQVLLSERASNEGTAMIKAAIEGKSNVIPSRILSFLISCLSISSSCNFGATSYYIVDHDIREVLVAEKNTDTVRLHVMKYEDLPIYVKKALDVITPPTARMIALKLGIPLCLAVKLYLGKEVCVNNCKFDIEGAGLGVARVGMTWIVGEYRTEYWVLKTVSPTKAYITMRKIEERTGKKISRLSANILPALARL